MARKDDSEENLDYHRLRTNRMFKKNGDWFFRTREGTVEGPYADEWEAKTWIDLYISFIGSGPSSVEDHHSLSPPKLDKVG